MANDLDLGGDVAELRPRGFSRFFNAAFLGVWLCGWVMGELFALAAVVWIVRNAFFPNAFPQTFPSHGPGFGAGAFAILLFLAFWLTLWTFGGIAALSEFVRSLGGVDLLWVEGGDLRIRSAFGPLHKERVLPRATVRRLYETQHQLALAAATDRGEVTITTFGTREERMQLAERLRRQLGIPRGEAAAESDRTSPPVGWAIAMEPGAETAIDRDPRGRALGGRICGVLALGGVGAAIAWLATGERSLLSPTTWAGLLPVALFIALMACGWLWFAHGMDRMRVRHGSLTIERRFAGRTWTWTFEPPVLTLERSVDSDGDVRFHLYVLRAERKRRRLASSLHIAREPLHLGRWIAHQTGAALHLPPGVEDA